MKVNDLIEVPQELLEAWFRHEEILKIGDPILVQVAKPVIRITQDTRKLIAKMERIMREARGVGIAAPQIGESTRIVIYDAGEGLQALINPRILAKRGEQLEPEEGCLSIPGFRGIVPRAMQITVQGFDGRGKPVKFRAEGYEARIIQHEVDHLDGILFYTLADQISLHWLHPDAMNEDDEDEVDEDEVLVDQEAI